MSPRAFRKLWVEHMLKHCSHFILIAAASGALALTTPAWAQAVLEGSGETSQIDCGGKEAHITGTDNQVTVEGACTLLIVEGSGNVVHADMAQQSSIRVVGTDNQVRWRAPGQNRPKTSSTGVGNSIGRAAAVAR